LFDEIVALGFDRSYATFTRQLRARRLRPPCEACRPAKGRPVAVIDHPAGEETQWDWVDLPDPPTAWGWGSNASLFVGALAHSRRWRGVLAESKDQPHTIDALDQITRQLGGLTRVWRSIGWRTTDCSQYPLGRSNYVARVSKSQGHHLPRCRRTAARCPGTMRQTVPKRHTSDSNTRQSPARSNARTQMHRNSVPTIRLASLLLTR